MESVYGFLRRLKMSCKISNTEILSVLEDFIDFLKDKEDENKKEKEVEVIVAEDNDVDEDFDSAIDKIAKGE